MKQIKVYFFIFLAFILIVPIGTLSHELGHIATARFFGYQSTLHFGSMFYDGENNSYLDTELVDFLIILAGPVSSVLISLIGFYLIHKKPLHKIQKHWLSGSTLLYLLLCLFMSRELFISLNIILKIGNYPGTDEYIIASYLQWDPIVFSVIIAVFAFGMCVYAILKCVVSRFLPYFLITFLLGSFFGFIFWMKLIGPWLLP